jgi:hypothetical protein
MVKVLRMSRIIISIIIFSLFLASFSCVTEKLKKSDDNNQPIYGPFSEIQFQEIRNTSEKLVEILLQIPNNNTSVNTMSFQKNKNFRNHTDGIICRACHKTLNLFHQFLEKKYGLFILNDMLALLCSITLDHSVCLKAINLYAPTVLDSLVEHYLDAEYICTKAMLCEYAHYYELNADDYAKELLKDKPSKPAILQDSGNFLKILHVTDIHTDLNYTEVNILFI